MRQEKKTELTKEKIIKAAIEEFGTKGYVSASLNTICNTGISKGLLYHNFENKDAIYLACVKRCFCDLTDYLKKQNIGANPQNYMSARLKYFSENKKYAHLFFEAVIQPPLHLQKKIKELRTDFDMLNKELYKNVLSTVTLRTGVSKKEALSYFTLMQTMFNGYFSSPAYRELSFSDRMIAHEENLIKLLDFMLYGIAEREVTK